METNRQRRLVLLIIVLTLMLLGFCYGPAEERAGISLPEAGKGQAPGEIVKTDLSIELEAPGDRASPPAVEVPFPVAKDDDTKRKAEGCGSGACPVERNTLKGPEARGENGKTPSLGEMAPAGAASGPEKAPAVQPSTTPPAPPPAPAPGAPVTYAWRGAHQVTFRSEVQVTNTGSERAENVWVDLPMLENSSPYQDTGLLSTNYEIAYMSGRIGSFGVGDIEPGATITIQTNYAITIRPLTINSSNETTEKARQVYQQYAGGGNCFELASGFAGRCRELGVSARVVNGFAGARGCNISAGSLEGRRHSWAEFYVDGLGWVPVDLTFGYFADFPSASHIVETYADAAIRAYHLGGTISMKWNNMIL